MAGAKRRMLALHSSTLMEITTSTKIFNKSL